MLIIKRRTRHLEVIFNPYTIVSASNRIEVQWIKLMELLKLMHVFGVQVAVGIAVDVLNCFLCVCTEAFGVCVTASLNPWRRIILVYAWSPLWPTGNLKMLFQVLCRCHGPWLKILWSIVVVSDYFVGDIVPKVVTFGVNGWFQHAQFGLLLYVVFHHLIFGIHEVHVNYARFCKLRKSFVRRYPAMERCPWSNGICARFAMRPREFVDVYERLGALMVAWTARQVVLLHKRGEVGHLLRS